MKTDNLGYSSSAVTRIGSHDTQPFYQACDDGNINNVAVVVRLAQQRREELMALATPAMIELTLIGD